MRPRYLPAVIAISILGASFTGLGQAEKLTTAEAKSHTGEGRYAPRAASQPS